MVFQYTKKWSEELLSLGLLRHPFEKEEERFLELLFMGEGSADVNVAKDIILTLQNAASGRDQSVYGVLSSIDYKLYYQAVFITADVFLKLGKETAIILLDWTARDLTEDEYSIVLDMARTYLTIEQQRKYYNLMEEYGYMEGFQNKKIKRLLKFFDVNINKKEG